MSVRTTACSSFEEFWPLYLAAHRSAGNRWLHFVGTMLAVLCLPAAIVLLEPWLLLAAPVIGYGLAWVGHFLVEGNRPETFGSPAWSMRGNFRMTWLMLIGRLGPELKRLETPGSSVPN